MSSTSSVGPSPAPTTPPAPQNTPQPDKSADAGAASATASKPDDSNAQSTNAVQPSKPPGQGQVVYISV
jgi:hypothetical protein